jgi:sorbose reductase
MNTDRITIQQLFSLEQKVVLVTGGASGIGKIVSEHLAAVGANIVIFDVQQEKAEIVAKNIADMYGVNTLAMTCDVTDPDKVEKCINISAEKMGTLDVLFNNAGIGMHKFCLDVTPDDWKKVNDVNYNGVFYVATAFARFLVKNKKPGSIINTASMSGTIVNVPQEQVAYNSSKAGVIQMTRSMSVELAHFGIRVNSISPGYMKSEMTAQRPQELRDFWNTRIPLGRMGTPKELATAVIYLAADSSSYTTGSNIIIDGGYTVL